MSYSFAKSKFSHSNKTKKPTMYGSLGQLTVRNVITINNFVMIYVLK